VIAQSTHLIEIGAVKATTEWDIAQNSQIALQSLPANPAVAYRPHNAKLISAFGIGLNVRISHRTAEQCRRDIRTAEASHSLICEGIFERRGSDADWVHRSFLKLAPKRSMNAQRYIRLLAHLKSRNLLYGKFIGGAIDLNSSRSLTRPKLVEVSLSSRRRLEHVCALPFRHGPNPPSVISGVA
jgi:hypothetical protein